MKLKSNRFKTRNEKLAEHQAIKMHENTDLLIDVNDRTKKQLACLANKGFYIP